ISSYLSKKHDATTLRKVLYHTSFLSLASLLIRARSANTVSYEPSLNLDKTRPVLECYSNVPAGLLKRIADHASQLDSSTKNRHDAKLVLQVGGDARKILDEVISFLQIHFCPEGARVA